MRKQHHRKRNKHRLPQKLLAFILVGMMVATSGAGFVNAEATSDSTSTEQSAETTDTDTTTPTDESTGEETTPAEGTDVAGDAGSDISDEGKTEDKTEEASEDKSVTELTGQDCDISVKVTFDEKQPEGTALKVTEVKSDSDQYKDFYKKSKIEMLDQDENVVSGAAYFAIQIVNKDGEVVEPTSGADIDVKVKGIDTAGDEKVDVISFTKDDLEIFDKATAVLTDKDGNESEGKTVDSEGTVSEFKFHVDNYDDETFGTFLSSKRTTSDGQYVIVRKSGEDYYALGSDGKAVKVDYDAEKNTASVATDKDSSSEESSVETTAGSSSVLADAVSGGGATDDSTSEDKKTDESIIWTKKGDTLSNDGKYLSLGSDLVSEDADNVYVTEPDSDNQAAIYSVDISGEKLDKTATFHTLVLKDGEFSVLDLEDEPENKTILAKAEAIQAEETTDKSDDQKSDDEDKTDEKTDEEKTDEESAAGTLNAESDNYSVSISYDSDANIPEGATLHVSEIAEDSESYTAAKNAVIEKKKEADADFDESKLGLKALDISILDSDGNEIEPEGKVKVSIKASNLPDGVDKIDIHHITGTSGIDLTGNSTMSLIKKAPAADGSVSQTAEEVADGIAVTDGKAEAEFTVDSFSSFTISYDTLGATTSGRTYPVAEITVKYVNENGEEIGDNPPTNISEVHTWWGNPEIYTLSDYAVTIDGYEYTGAYINKDSINTAMSAPVQQGTQVWTLRFRNISTGLSLTPHHYVSFEDPTKDGPGTFTGTDTYDALIWRQEWEDGQRVSNANNDTQYEQIKATVYLVYHEDNFAKVNIHYVDTDGNELPSDLIPASTTDTPNPITGMANKSYSLSPYAQTVSGYTYKGIYLENGTSGSTTNSSDKYNGVEPEVTDFQLNRSGSNGSFVRTLVFNNGSTQVQSTTVSDSTATDGVIERDVYVVYYKPFAEVEIHYVDENGTQIKDSVTVDGSDSSTYRLTSYATSIDGFVYQGPHYYMGDPQTDNEVTYFSFRNTTRSVVFYKTDADTNNDVVLDTATYTDSLIHKDVYLVYNRIYARVTLHYIDTDGNELTNSTTDSTTDSFNVMAGDNYLFSFYAAEVTDSSNSSSYTYQNAYLETGSGEGQTYSSTDDKLVTGTHIVTTGDETKTQSLVFYKTADGTTTDEDTTVYDNTLITKDVYLVYVKGEDPNTYVHYVDHSGRQLYRKYGFRGITWGDAYKSNTYVDDNATYVSHLIYDVDGYDYDYTYVVHNGSQTNIVPTLKYFDYSSASSRNTPSWYSSAGIYYRTTSSISSSGTVRWTPLYSSDEIYVVYKDKPSAAQGQNASNSNAERPSDVENLPNNSTKKSSADNGDGTRTISLDVTGKEADSETPTYANVIVVFDRSGSMTETMDGETASSTDDTRLAIAKQALTGSGGLLDTLLPNTNSSDNLTRVALISFSSTARVDQGFTSDKSTLSTAINNLSASGATNWEDALKKANELSLSGSSSGAFQNAPTYVIFVTDGDPSMRNSRGDVAESDLTYENDHLDRDFYYYYYDTDDSQAYYYDRMASSRYSNYGVFGNGGYQQLDYDFALDQAKSIVNHNKLFYSIGVSSDVTRLQSFTTSAGGEGCYIATSQSDLTDAFGKITAKIKIKMGFSDVKISDGITGLADVNGKVSGNVGNFTYWIKRSGDNDFSEWTDHPTDASYNSTTGAVEWNLGDDFQLEDGTTYRVSFTVWPDQEALDHVAKLNNGLESWDTLDSDVKGQITRSGSSGNYTYSLKTNTDVNMTYKDSSTIGGETTSSGSDKDGSVDDSNIQGITIPTNNLTVSKSYADGTSNDKVSLTIVQADTGTAYSDTFLVCGTYENGDPDDTGSTGNRGGVRPSTATREVSTGIMDKDGNILSPGHDFTVTESGSNASKWNLSAPVYHPMVVNGAQRMYVRDDTTTLDGTTNTFELNGHKYKIVSGNSATLSAVNETKRSMSS